MNCVDLNTNGFPPHFSVVLPPATKTLYLPDIDKKITKTKSHISHLSNGLAHRNTHGGRKFRARNISTKDQISHACKRLERLEKARALVLKADSIAKSPLRMYLTESVLDSLFHASIVDGEIDLAASFIRQGASVSKLYEGISPLYRACENGKIKIAELLLKKGASPTQKNDLSHSVDKYWQTNDLMGRHGATPMHAAAVAGDKNLVRLLLSSYKGPFEEMDRRGFTPVFTAVHCCNEEIALFFIEGGANIKIKDNHGISLISMAVSCGLFGVVKELVGRGVNVNEKDRNGSTVLHDAAGRQHPELLSFLLLNGAKDSINVLWLNKWTPLSAASQAGSIDNVKLLVEAGADLSIKYEGLDILAFSKKELRVSESFYESRPEYREEGERVLRNRRAIVEYLQIAISERHVCLIFLLSNE